MNPPSYYEVLGVPPTASLDDIRAAYRAKARSHHPDAGGSAARMQAVNRAWVVLRDPARRAVYDRELTDGFGGGLGASAPGDGTPGRQGDPEPDTRSAADWAELFDTRPLGPTQALEGWWALLPPAALMAAIGLLVGGIFFTSPPLLVFSVLWFFLALALFVLAPLRAMTRTRPGSRRS